MRPRFVGDEPDTYALAPLAGGLALISRALLEPGPARLRTFLAGGALVALATSFRAQHVLDALLIAAWVLAAGGPARVRKLTAYAVGGMAWTVLMLAVVWWQGYLPEMLRDAVLGSAGYAAGKEGAHPPNLGMVVWALRTNVDLMPLTWLCAGGGCALAAAAWRGLGRPQRWLLVLAALLFAATFRV